MVKAGETGDRVSAQGPRISRDWLLLPTDWNWRGLNWSVAGACAVVDTGSHWLDLLTF